MNFTFVSNTHQYLVTDKRPFQSLYLAHARRYKVYSCLALSITSVTRFFQAAPLASSMTFEHAMHFFRCYVSSINQKFLYVSFKIQLCMFQNDVLFGSKCMQLRLFFLVFIQVRLYNFHHPSRFLFRNYSKNRSLILIIGYDLALDI